MFRAVIKVLSYGEESLLAGGLFCKVDGIRLVHLQQFILIAAHAFVSNKIPRQGCLGSREVGRVRSDMLHELR